MRDEVPGTDGLEDETRAYLTRQQRYLLLAEPIARLSIDRRVVFRDDPAIAELDVQYLALSALDFVMERSAIESGAPPADIVDHVASEATRIRPTLTEEQSRKAGHVVLDSQSGRTRALPGCAYTRPEFRQLARTRLDMKSAIREADDQGLAESTRPICVFRSSAGTR